MTPVDADSAARVAALVDRLASSNITLAVAESLTGGLLCSTLINPPGASRVVRGGIVAYATDIKASALGVDAKHLAEHGAVNAEVAIAMAEGVRARMAASIGIATTGVAGPDPQDGVAPGTAFVAIAFGGDRPPVVDKLTVPGSRDEVRLRAVLAAIALLENSLRAE